MKNLLYLNILMALIATACRDESLLLRTTDTGQKFTFEAQYSKSKTSRLEKYLDSALHNDLALEQNVDLVIPLNANEKFNLKAKSGWLEINFNKQNSSLNGYLKVRKLTEDIQRVLKED